MFGVATDSGGVSFTNLLLEEGEEDVLLVSRFKQTYHTIEDVVDQTCNKWLESKNNDNVRKMNPMLFIKCLLVQTYSEDSRCKFIYDDTIADWKYISKHILDMLEEKRLSIIELITLSHPVFALQRDGSIIYYESHRWVTAQHKFEHLFLPSKILKQFGHLYQDDDDNAAGDDDQILEFDIPNKNNRPTSNKKKRNRQQWLYTHLITFWGRVDILEFPSNVISFNDGFVLIKNNYTFFFHTPMFKGQPSNLNWNSLLPIIQHVNNPNCTYPQLIEQLLIPPTTTVEIPPKIAAVDNSIIDYFKYSYKKECWPKLEVQALKICNTCRVCPVYETLKYMLTLFSGDVELVIYILWTLRYTLLGISIKKVLIFYGIGNNGKSTFANVLRVLFGSSMNIISQETIGGKIGTLCPDLYQARRAKIIYSDDLTKINAASLKQLVSGAYLYVRTLYSAGENILMKALFIGSSNSLQICLDYATMKRLFVIPFTNFFSDSTKYYCNTETYETLAANMLGTIFWLERFTEATNIFYGTDMNIVNPPKSVKYFTNQAVWKHFDPTSSFITLFNLREQLGTFIRIDDLVTEINLAKGMRSSKIFMNTFFNDIEAIINLLKHRYDVGKVLNKTENVYEDAIFNITIDKYKLLYDRAYEMI